MDTILKEKALSVIRNHVNRNQMICEEGILDSILCSFVVITKPVAKYGDTVSVLNYRKRPAEFEIGKVTSYKLKGIRDDLQWQYEVVLDRKSDLDNPIFLIVGDSDVEIINDILE